MWRSDTNAPCKHPNFQPHHRSRGQEVHVNPKFRRPDEWNSIISQHSTFLKLPFDNNTFSCRHKQNHRAALFLTGLSPPQRFIVSKKGVPAAAAAGLQGRARWILVLSAPVIVGVWTELDASPANVEGTNKLKLWWLLHPTRGSLKTCKKVIKAVMTLHDAVKVLNDTINS